VTFSETFIHNKVARRVFLMFVSCALIPITLLAATGFWRVTKQLEEQTGEQLRDIAKTEGMSIYERLQFLENDMKVIGLDRNLPAGPSARAAAALAASVGSAEERFNGLELLVDSRSILLAGRVHEPPALSAAEQEYLASGRTVVTSNDCGESLPCVWMIRQLDPRYPQRGVLRGEIKASYLWPVDRAPALINLCVLDDAQRVLACSNPGAAPVFSAKVAGAMSASWFGQFRWAKEGNEYLAAYSSIYLKPVFFCASMVRGGE
jgi:hypothetical protein